MAGRPRSSLDGEHCALREQEFRLLSPPVCFQYFWRSWTRWVKPGFYGQPVSPFVLLPAHAASAAGSDGFPDVIDSGIIASVHDGFHVGPSGAPALSVPVFSLLNLHDLHNIFRQAGRIDCPLQVRKKQPGKKKKSIVPTSAIPVRRKEDFGVSCSQIMAFPRTSDPDPVPVIGVVYIYHKGSLFPQRENPERER